ncbi:MAG: late competence development ComFB family protein [Spirochaetaceae bacterium]
MAIDDFYDLSDLRNDTERLVFEELERQLKTAGPEVPRSQESVLDMAAYALNHARPLYRVNLIGRLYALSSTEQRDREVRAAVAEAIKRVTEHPPA